MTTASPLRCEFLERLSRPLLVRLLAPHDELLAANGISLSALLATHQDDRRLVRALYRLLTSPSNSPERAALLQLLVNVSRVASTAGRDALIRADVNRCLDARLGEENLAATAHLDHPELFATVRTGSQTDAVKNFALYRAGAERTIRVGDTEIAEAERLLGRFFEPRHRTGYVEILVTRRGSEFHFQIRHGKTPHTHDLVSNELATTVVTQVATQAAYAIYDEGTRVLSIHALDFIKEGVRVCFGEAFAGDATCFEKTEALVSLSVLSSLDAALAPDPLGGVLHVELRRLEIQFIDRMTMVAEIAKGDLRACSQRKWVEESLKAEGATVVSIKIAVTTAASGVTQKRPLLAVIHGPRSQLEYDRRDAQVEAVFLGWLASRGIWHGVRTLPALGAAATA